MTNYEFTNWFPQGFTFTKENISYSYETLLETLLGSQNVLLYIETDDYQGDWAAFVTDGKQIGLVEGSFGSCDGCDALQAAYGSLTEVASLMEEYLQSVRTFGAWEEVRKYLSECERERRWSFRNERKTLEEYALRDLPLHVAQAATTFRGDGAPLDRAVEMAHLVTR